MNYIIEQSLNVLKKITKKAKEKHNRKQLKMLKFKRCSLNILFVQKADHPL